MSSRLVLPLITFQRTNDLYHDIELEDLFEKKVLQFVSEVYMCARWMCHESQYTMPIIHHRHGLPTRSTGNGRSHAIDVTYSMTCTIQVEIKAMFLGTRRFVVVEMRRLASE